LTKLIQIDEVLGRSEQGITQPFLCSATDGKRYFVKGQGAGYSSLVKELIVGELAKEFGLPVAPFEILEMPKSFFNGLPNVELKDLGFGPVFGSQVCENVSEMTTSDLKSADVKCMEDILFFDWWVRNGDRTLTAFGGNPNLLWSAGDKKVTVIDFNLAFDDKVTRESIVDEHIFRDYFDHVADDEGRRTEYCHRFGLCLKAWDEIVSSVPERWLFADQEQSVPIPFKFTEAKSELDRYPDGAFWFK
jgi:hypothetical protein